MLSRDLKKLLQKQTTELTMKLMADDRTRPYIAKALQGIMQGRQSFEKRRRELLQSLSLASQEDLDNLRREAAKLKRQLAQLSEQLAALEAQL